MMTCDDHHDEKAATVMILLHENHASVLLRNDLGFFFFNPWMQHETISAFHLLDSKVLKKEGHSNRKGVGFSSNAECRISVPVSSTFEQILFPGETLVVQHVSSSL